MTEELLKHIVQEKKAYLDMRTADYCNRSNNLKSVVLVGKVGARELVIDISGAAKQMMLNNDAVYFSGIGPLTIAVLVNRIAVHCMNGVCM